MIKDFNFHIQLFIFLLLTLNTFASTNKKKDLLKQTKFPPCKACKVYVESFKKGMVKTERGKFEGGDADWEEKKLGSYANSEIRLVEIQESVCSDVDESQDQCYSLNEQHDAVIEDWWFNHQNDEPDLFKYICINKLEHCCPDDHYGPKCTQCLGYPDSICNNNGICKGAGTRKGNGKCHCDKGYAGDSCNGCALKYFEAYKDEKKLLCSECHVSCDGKCLKAGPTGCEKCASGWIQDKEKGCLDINECAQPKVPCSPLQFCVNTDGSYQCLDCDKSCAGCTGDGPDMCLKCASGFIMKGNMCMDAEQEIRQMHVDLTRYCTYLGLCIATCIIFQKSVSLAALVGVIVATYISLSEYMLTTPPTPVSKDILDKVFNN